MLLLRESLTFYKETLGHPDPEKRTGLKTVLILAVVMTVMIFAYQYGASIVKVLTNPPKHYQVLEQENMELRIVVGRKTRELNSCIAERDDILESYNYVLEHQDLLPKVPERQRNSEFYDRLGELR